MEPWSEAVRVIREECREEGYPVPTTWQVTTGRSVWDHIRSLNPEPDFHVVAYPSAGDGIFIDVTGDSASLLIGIDTLDRDTHRPLFGSLNLPIKFEGEPIALTTGWASWGHVTANFITDGIARMRPFPQKDHNAAPRP